MSDVNYNELKKKIMSFITTEIKEKRLSGTPDGVYEEWHKKFKDKLQVASDNAIMRFIAAQKCDIVVHTSIEPTPDSSVSKRVQIKDLGLNLKSVELVARVKRVSHGVTRQKQTKYTTITITDGTGSVDISFWKEEADKMKKIPKGELVHIKGYVDKAYNQPPPAFDLKIGRWGYFEVMDDESDAPDIPLEDNVLIKDIKPTTKHVDLVGRIVKLWELKNTRSGSQYLTFSVSDRDGDQISVKIFNEPLAKKIANDFKEGDTVKLENVNASEWKGTVSLQNDWDDTQVTKLVEDVEMPVVEYKGRNANAVEKPLVDVKDGDAVEFVGMFTKLYATKPYYDMCPRQDCFKGVRDGECDVHGKIDEDSIPRPRLSGEVTDCETAIKFSMMGDIVEEVLGVNASTIKEQYDSMGDAKAFVEAFTDKIQGKFYRIVGSVKLDKGYRGDLDIMVNKLMPISFEDEAEKISQEVKATT